MSTYPQHSSPVRFDWEPLEGAVRYDILVNEYSDSPYSYVGAAISESRTSEFIECNLAPSQSNRHYEFTAYAYNAGGDVIGYYMTTYDAGYGWDYRFTVGSP